MEKIEFHREVFDLVNDLCQINKSVIFEKENDNIIIKQMDAEKTIAYVLEAPKEYFNFGDDNIAFYNFPEFYQFFRTVENGDLYKEENIIKLSNKNSKINYLLSNPESIGVTSKKPNLNDLDLRFLLTSNDLSEIIKMDSLIKAKRAQIYGNDSNITIKIHNDLCDNSFEKTYVIENLSGYTESFDFEIFSEHFSKLPSRKDYIVEIKRTGFVKFMLVNDNNLNLNIYTGSVKRA